MKPTIRIQRINCKHFHYVEAYGKDIHLIAFSMPELTQQLFDIYGLDYRKYLFNPVNLN